MHISAGIRVIKFIAMADPHNVDTVDTINIEYDETELSQLAAPEAAAEADSQESREGGPSASQPVAEEEKATQKAKVPAPPLARCPGKTLFPLSRVQKIMKADKVRFVLVVSS